MEEKRQLLGGLKNKLVLRKRCEDLVCREAGRGFLPLEFDGELSVEGRRSWKTSTGAT